MVITHKERVEFPKKYKWMTEHMCIATGVIPTHLEILAAIMVMEREDPTKLIELIKEIKDIDE